MGLIKSINYSQTDIIRDILELHAPNGIDLDPTYSKGNFYKQIPKPNLKYDISPQTIDTQKADARDLPVESNSINCIMFDPPFVVGPSKSKSIVRDRFGCYKNIPELLKFYKDSLVELYRILKIDGVLIFKCQDTVSSGKQWITHVEVINRAKEVGFYCKDLFILLAKNRAISPNMLNQKHARKYHSYFLVLEK